MEAWLIDLVTTHPFYVYGFIIILACAEGPILSMIFGAILRLGYVKLIPIYATLMIGDLIGDIVWYYIGRYFGYRFIKRFGKYFNLTEAGVAKVTAIFHHYKHRILFISKISNGFGFALVTLMTAGMVRIPFRRYLLINVIGQFVWTGLLLAVGYFFGHAYVTINNILGKISIVALFVIVILAFNGYRKYWSKRAEKMIV